MSTSWLTRQPNRLNQIAVAFPTQCNAGSLKRDSFYFSFPCSLSDVKLILLVIGRVLANENSLCLINRSSLLFFFWSLSSWEWAQSGRVMDEPGEVHEVSYIVPGTEISDANMQHGTVDVKPPWSTLPFSRLHFMPTGNKQWVLAGSSMAGTSPSCDEIASWHQDKFAVWCAFSEKGDQVLDFYFTMTALYRKLATN